MTFSHTEAGTAVVVAAEIARRVGIDEIRFGAGQVGRAFIDLVKRIRADHQRTGGRIDHRLRQRKQRFARTVHGQDLRGRIELGDAIAALQPAGDGATQGFRTDGGRIAGQAMDIVDQRLLDEGRRRVLGFAHAQADGRILGIDRHAGKQLAQLFEWIWLQFSKKWIHGTDQGKSGKTMLLSDYLARQT